MKEGKGTQVFLQCLVTAVLVFGCFAVKYKQNTKTVSVSAFGYSSRANDTVSDFAENLYNDYLEKNNE